MAGIDTLRGIYYQVIGSLLLFLGENKNIDYIEIEPFKESEKVDLLIKLKNGEKGVIQVKSSKRKITLSNGKRWAKELEKTAKADNYTLLLFGHQAEGLLIFPKVGKVRIYPPMNMNLDALMEQACFRLLNYINKYSLSENFLKPKQLKSIIEILVTRLFDKAIHNLKFKEIEIREILKSNIIENKKLNNKDFFSSIFIKNDDWNVHYNFYSFLLRKKTIYFEGYGDFGKCNHLIIDVILSMGDNEKLLTQVGISLAKMTSIEYPKGAATPKFREVVESKYHFKLQTLDFRNELPKEWMIKTLRRNKHSNGDIIKLKTGPEIEFSSRITNPIILPKKQYFRFKITVQNYLLHIENNSLIRLFARFGSETIYSDYIHINSLI